MTMMIERAQRVARTGFAPKAITYNGRTQTAAEWAAELGVQPWCVYRAVSLGRDLESVQTRPKGREARVLTWKGRSQTIAAWAKELNLPRPSIDTALRQGKSLDDLEKRANRAVRKKGKDPILIAWNGRAQSAEAWSVELGVCKPSIYAAIREGRTIGDILARARRPRRKGYTKSTTRQLTWDGRSQTVSAWANEFGLAPVTVYNALARGTTLAEIAARSPRKGRRSERVVLEKLRFAFLILEQVGPVRADPIFEALRGKSLDVFKQAYHAALDQGARLRGRREGEREP